MTATSTVSKTVASYTESDDIEDEEIQFVLKILRNHFNSVKVFQMPAKDTGDEDDDDDDENICIEVTSGVHHAKIFYETTAIECKNAALKNKIKDLLQKSQRAVLPVCVEI